VGTSSSWRPAVSSLAHHLICEYRVPVFLSFSWYATDSAADKKRGWFISHSRGASFRSLNLPIVMTRKMEHIFLASPDHLPIEHAIRRAELLALGTPTDFVKAIMSTRLATDLRHGEFWRTVSAATRNLACSFCPIAESFRTLRNRGRSRAAPMATLIELST
jgi:hypothetical protein